MGKLKCKGFAHSHRYVFVVVRKISTVQPFKCDSSMQYLVKNIVTIITCGFAAASTPSDSSIGDLAVNVSDDDVLFSGPTLNSGAIFNALTPVYNDTSLGL